MQSEAYCSEGKHSSIVIQLSALFILSLSFPPPPGTVNFIDGARQNKDPYTAPFFRGSVMETVARRLSVSWGINLGHGLPLAGKRPWQHQEKQG